jgi:RNA polymerase sigma factor (TIGR02999 family)
MPVVYGELKRRAAAYLKREGRNHTLQPTELVHEAYLRLSAQNNGWQNRDQFFGVAANLMRRILVDHARARKAAKRGGGLAITLVDRLAASAPRAHDLIALDEALNELTALDARQGLLVELRFFGGFTMAEAAGTLAVSLATANREWALAKAWLYRRLKERGAVGEGVDGSSPG